MNVRRAFVVSKVTLYELAMEYGKDKRVKRLIEAGDPLVEKVIISHQETVMARELVRSCIEKKQIKSTWGYPFHRIKDGVFDLIIVIGGDGTVLDMARFINNTPILAVNSSPSTSKGHFCLTTAENFLENIEKIQEGSIHPKQLTRIRIDVDNQTYRYPALNDVLIAHQSPAATSRYVIEVRGQAEEQKSSGVWICTGAGSTGAMMSAGGERMPMDDRRLQYLVREPWAQCEYRLLRGMIGTEGISFVSRMMHGRLYLDGRRLSVKFLYGQRILLTPTANPLLIFI